MNKGDKHGQLTAIEFTRRGSGGQHFWKFKCDCGTILERRKENVVRSKNAMCKSCNSKELSKRLTGASHHAWKGGGRDPKTNKLYRCWAHMISRCNYPQSDNYNYYGGRGIKILWNSYEEFEKDMKESFIIHESEHGGRNTSLDRIDVNGHYSKENCRWATQKEQARNTRKNRFYTLDTGEIKIQTDLTVNERREVIGGWDKEDIIHGKKLPNTGDMRKQERNFKEEKKVMMDRFKLSSQVVYTYLSVLDDRERNIIEKRFGLNTGKRATLQEIADEQNVTRERVRQIEYKAIEKMVRFYSDITY